MADIDQCKSQLFSWYTSSYPSTFAQQFQLSFRPDVAIVRQIAVFDANPDVADGQYYINSDINGSSVIGCFQIVNNTYTASGATMGTCSFVCNPQTVIPNVQGMSNVVTFQVSLISGAGFIPATALLGYITVQIDFIKYKVSR